MTLQDLKENREDIIYYITEKVGADNVKLVMEKCVQALPAFENESDVEYFVAEVIDMFGIKNNIATAWGVNTPYSTQSEYQRAMLNKKIELPL